MADNYTIVLSVTVDDPSDDPRLWDYDALLGTALDEPDRYVRYIYGAKQARD